MPDPSFRTADEALVFAASMPRDKFTAWIEQRQAANQAAREADCDRNGRHLVLASGERLCGHCHRPVVSGPDGGYRDTRERHRPVTATDRYDLWESRTLCAAAEWAFGTADEPTDVHRGDCQVWTSDDPCDCGAGHA